MSGNTCYYEGCEEVLTNPDWNAVNGEIAHICGEKPKAARYDSRMTPEERNGFDNLMLLCPQHHKLIDRLEPGAHPVQRLLEMKAQHELRSLAKTAWATEEQLDRYAMEIVVAFVASEADDDDPSRMFVELKAEPPDPWTGIEHVNEDYYDGNVKLWVRVTNRGPTAEFSAQISNTEGFPASWVDYTRPIAWEATSDTVLRIAPETHTRLLLGNLARKPPCFWFYGPQDELYTKAVHTTWQQNRHFDGHIAFDLQVVNLTTNALEVKRGVVTHSDPDALPVFTLE